MKAVGAAISLSVFAISIAVISLNYVFSICDASQEAKQFAYECGRNSKSVHKKIVELTQDGLYSITDHEKIIWLVNEERRPNITLEMLRSQP